MRNKNLIVIFLIVCIFFTGCVSETVPDEKYQAPGSDSSPFSKVNFITDKFSVQYQIENGEVRSIGPGGAGLYISVKAHPRDSSFVVAGTNVAGAFLSLDQGKSWKSISYGLGSSVIEDIEYLIDEDKTTIFLATATGVYKSVQFEDINDVDLTNMWELKNNGLLQGTGENLYTHPVSDIAIAGKTIWLGLGDLQGTSAGDFDFGVIPAKRCDEYQIYKSTDYGESWKPALKLDTGWDGNCPNNSVPENVGPAIFEIEVDPENNETVYVVSDMGAYITPNSGNSWYEIGVDKLIKTRDEGNTWEFCSDVDVPCLSWLSPGCTQDKCLPISLKTGESHPNLRNMEISKNQNGEQILFFTYFDTGYSESCEEKDLERGWKEDNEFNESKVGLYISESYGKNWKHEIGNLTGSTYGVSFRCSDSDRVGHNTIYRVLEVDPSNSNSRFMGAYNYIGGKVFGLYEFTGGKWRTLTSSRDSNDQCYLDNDKNCFEGGRTQGLWGGSANVGIIDLEILDWDSKKFIYGFPRGIAIGTKSGEKYSIDFADSEIQNDGSWSSTGTSDFCPFGVTKLNEETYVWMADGGVIKLNEDANSWKLERDQENSHLPSSNFKWDDTQVLVNNGKKLYATNFWSKDTNSNSVIVGPNWKIIGGYCWGVEDCAESENDNGLPVNVQVTSLQRTDKYLVAATKNDGIFVYNSLIDKGKQWSRISNCYPSDEGEVAVEELAIVSKDSVVAVVDAESNSVDGVYHINLDEKKRKCVKLEGGEKVRNPNTLVIGESKSGEVSIVVGGEKLGYPILYQSKFNPVSLEVEWIDALDFIPLIKLAITEEKYEEFANEWFDKKEFSVLAVSPNNPLFIVAGMRGYPNHDFSLAQNLFVSYNGGESFDILEVDLPVKNIQNINLIDDQIYFSTTCSDLYQMCSPFESEC